MAKKKELYCTCGRPQGDHEKGYGRSPTGCEAFKLRGRGDQVEIIRMVRPGCMSNTEAPTYLVRCPRCKKEYETKAYPRDIITRRSCRACMKLRRIRNPLRAAPPLGMPKAERFLHGTRSRYVSGCRCGACNEANNEYARMNQKLVRAGETNKLVPVTRVKAHLEKLSNAGIGLRSIADVAKVGRSILQEIRNGLKDHTREKTEAAILAVTVESCINDGHRIDAGPTQRLIEKLLKDHGYTRTELARALGSKAKVPALRIDLGDKVTARNAALVEKLYREAIGH